MRTNDTAVRVEEESVIFKWHIDRRKTQPPTDPSLCHRLTFLPVGQRCLSINAFAHFV